MPVELTDPIALGAVAPAATHAKILRFVHDATKNRIDIDLWFGTVSNNVFVPSPYVHGITVVEFVIQDQDYIDLVLKTPTNTTDRIYDHVAHNLYQWLLDNEHLYGTIV